MKFGASNKILIIGNSGSGKSWLAGKLAQSLDLAQFALDEIKWEKGGFYKEKEDSIVFSELNDITSRSNFVIEGVYGDLARFLSDHISHFIWLDIDSEMCAESVVSRGFDQIPWMDSEKKIIAYLDHIKSYERSTGSMSRSSHEEVYKSFSGMKVRFESRGEVNSFASSLGASC
jgi:adenylate kinase family enzyme